MRAVKRKSYRVKTESETRACEASRSEKKLILRKKPCVAVNHRTEGLTIISCYLGASYSRWWNSRAFIQKILCARKDFNNVSLSLIKRPFNYEMLDYAPRQSWTSKRFLGFRTSVANGQKVRLGQGRLRIRLRVKRNCFFILVAKKAFCEG